MRIGLLMLGNASVQAMVGRARLAEDGRLPSLTGEFVFGSATLKRRPHRASRICVDFVDERLSVSKIDDRSRALRKSREQQR